MKINEIKNKKSIAAIGIATAAVTVMVSAFSVMPAFAMQRSTSDSSSLPAYKTAYKKVIKNHYKADSEYSTPRYKLVYINNDSTPELVVSPNDQTLRVYSYANGKVHRLIRDIVMMDYSLNWKYIPKQNKLCYRSISLDSYERLDRPQYIDEKFYKINSSGTALVKTGKKQYKKGKEALKKRGYHGLTCIQLTDNGDIRTGKTYSQIMKQLSR